MTRYQATVYHDEPEDAAVDSRTVPGYFRTETQAAREARKHLNDYWQSATVHRGTLYEGELGVRPDWFEDDETATPLLVGPDWTDR